MAIFLDGVDDTFSFGDVTSFDTPTNITYMFWGYHTSTLGNGADHEILNKGASQLYCYVATTNANNITAGVSGVSARSTATGKWPNSTWTHIAITYDSGAGTRLVIYVNGVSETLSGTDPTFGDGGASGLGFSMGAALTRASFTIANLKLWTVTLTAAAVAQEMNSYLPSRTANLLIWSPFDDGTSFKDYSGNGNNGTAGGGAASAAGPPIGINAPYTLIG